MFTLDLDKNTREGFLTWKFESDRMKTSVVSVKNLSLKVMKTDDVLGGETQESGIPSNLKQVHEYVYSVYFRLILLYRNKIGSSDKLAQYFTDVYKNQNTSFVC